MTPQEALTYYFGYTDFRPMQAEIIASVLNGRDTLALLPTGGGKSLCFQIPALVTESLCLVITPLIALMKDQVENLRRRGIMAAAIYTGMSKDKQEVALDNCQYGPYRCLYVSPERLESEDFRRRLARLPIGLIAVDEAHCISQWGYDFRPSYLHIADLRTIITGTHSGSGASPAILALTATATPAVVEDIQDRLAFRERNVLCTSFRRPNLKYVVRKVTDALHCPSHTTFSFEGRACLGSSGARAKTAEMLHILSSVAGSKIVYVRNRKRAEELSKLINTQPATFYHAGLSPEERASRQEAWKSGEVPIIVCTNAFGMGVDKPDVRLVLHYDLPDSLEAYFQEAGRAGRDGQTAYAVLLYEKSDHAKALRRVPMQFPPKEFVERVYHNTCDFLGVGAHSGLGHSFALHLDELCRVMHLPLLQTVSALQILALAGYIDFEPEQVTQPRVRINVSRAEIASYSLTQEQQELLMALMRHYPGIFTDLQYIHEDSFSNLISSPMGGGREGAVFASLASRGIITYLPRTKAALFAFRMERQTSLCLSKAVYEQREERYVERLRAMLAYAECTDGFSTRESALLHYFGEQK